MNVSPRLIQTGVTFIAASLGAIFGALLTRRIEQFKHLQELRFSAYANFLRGCAKVCNAQQSEQRGERSDLEEFERRIIFTDSRSRIAIYCNHSVVRSLARFIKLGAQTRSPEGVQVFA